MQPLLDMTQFTVQEGDALDLLSVYKGLPVLCRATVFSLTKKSLTLNSRCAAMIPIIKNKYAQALGSAKHAPFQCFLTQAHLPGGMMEFEICPLDASQLGNRRSPRVEPKEALPVDLECEGRHVPAILLDISLEGMGVNVPQRFFTFALKPGAAIKVHLCLMQTELELHGWIVGVSRAGEHNRLAIHFDIPYKNGRALFAFVRQRRQEIEHELLDEYQAMLLWEGLTSPRQD